MATEDCIEKTCHICKQRKSLDDFHKLAKSKDGRQGRCKPCACALAKKWAKDNKERCDATRRAYYEANKDALYAANRTWLLAKPEKDSVYGKRYRDKNVEKEKARAKKYRDSHKQEALEYRRAYRASRPEMVRQWDANRRAQELKATPAWANEFFISEAYHLARLREKMCGGKWHVDHIVPLQSKLVCGLHVEQNLQVIPQTVNQSKSNRYWPDMPD